MEYTVGLSVAIAGRISETRWFPKMDINWAHGPGILTLRLVDDSVDDQKRDTEWMSYMGNQR